VRTHLPHGSSTQWLPGGLATLLVTVPLFTWLWSGGNPATYLAFQVPDGQLLYLLAKLAGLAAVVLMSVQLALGISGGVKPAPDGRSLLGVHRSLGLATFITVLLHATLFTVAASLRNRQVMAAYFWPDFSHGYYRSMIAMGALALMGLAIVISAGLLRKRFPRLGRWLHRASVPVYALVWIHSLTIGSESRMGPMPYVYGLLAMLIAAATVRRLVTMQRHTERRR
jgi:DMSO/TMAO reductase YedYZ heme-binding membrane subunit